MGPIRNRRIAWRSSFYCVVNGLQWKSDLPTTFRHERYVSDLSDTRRLVLSEEVVEHGRRLTSDERDATFIARITRFSRLHHLQFPFARSPINRICERRRCRVCCCAELVCQWLDWHRRNSAFGRTGTQSCTIS